MVRPDDLFWFFKNINMTIDFWTACAQSVNNAIKNYSSLGDTSKIDSRPFFLKVETSTKFVKFG